MTKRFTLIKVLLVIWVVGISYPILMELLSSELPLDWVVVTTSLVGGFMFGGLIAKLYLEQKDYKDYQ